MATLTSPTSTAPVATPEPSAPATGSWSWLMLGVFLTLLVAHLPAFLCLPVDGDVSQWDLCARTVRDGGVFYRDALENNLPGMLWLHLAIRSVVGWSSVAMRAVDLGVLAVIGCLLVRWLPAGCSVAARLATGFVLAALYLSMTEWCHCQRDPWMLLPALLALELRRRQLAVLLHNLPLLSRFLFRSVLEGLLWGAAFWLKPHVAVPAMLCWLVSASWCLGRAPGRRRLLMLDGLGVLVGGLVAGALGSAWLLATGAWTDFWDVMLVWNREYVADAVPIGERWLLVVGLLIRLFPWILIHGAAVPLACRNLWRGGRHGRTGGSIRGRILSAFYLGWLAQAVLLQHQFDYVHLPPLLLAVTLVCRHACLSTGMPRFLMVTFLILCVAFRLPALTSQRVALWNRCLREGSSVELRDQLSLRPRTNWSDLKKVQGYLVEQQIGDGELTCYNMPTTPLYLEMGLRPATRNFLLGNILPTFPGQRERVWSDLAVSHQRYLVIDVNLTEWKNGVPEDRLVFRSGRYAVYAVDARNMRGWMEAHVDM